MSKKKTSKLNKRLKAEQLQRLTHYSDEPIRPTPASIPAIATPTQSFEITPPSFLSKEITRTVISLAVVAALLVGAVIVDRRTQTFTHFGNWLSQTLRLNK